MTEKRKPPFGMDMDFGEAIQRFGQTDPEELATKASNNKGIAVKMPSKELAPAQRELDLQIECEREVDGVGMGVLSDGTPFLTGCGLARLIDIENLHVRTISQDWNDDPPKPRIAGIKAILAKQGIVYPEAHIEVQRGGTTIHAFPDAICLAVLEHYAFDASKVREKARDNYRLLAGKALRELIYSQVGYDPEGRLSDKFRKWHQRIELNHQSAPSGFFNVFNEAATVIYELIMAGAEIGEKFVPDISIRLHWSKNWESSGLEEKYGARAQYPHAYPDDHPQAKSNPQTAWCYPLEALGAYRTWLQNTYLADGKFANYLSGKVKQGQLPPSVAQLAIETMVPKQIEGPSV